MRSTLLVSGPLVLLLLWLTLEIAFAQNAMSPFSYKPFTDIPKSHPQYEAIEYLRTKNILKGDYTDGNYHPTRRIRRDELLGLVTNELFMARDNACVRVLGGTGAKVFPDVIGGSPYAVDICNAKAKGIVRGFHDGFFRPSRPVTFVEAAKIISRVFSVSMDSGNIEDPRWYFVYVNSLSEKNAIPKSVRSLRQSITRGEIAEMIYRLKTDTTSRPSAHWEDFDR